MRRTISNILICIGIVVLALRLYAAPASHGHWRAGLSNATIVILIGAGILYLFNRLARAQASLISQKALLKNAFEYTALGMCITSLELKYIAINQAYCDIVGFTKEELFQMIPFDFVHPDDRKIDQPLLQKLLDGKTASFSSTKRYIHKLGHVVWGQATVSLVRDDKGHPQYFVTQIQDISELVEAQAKLKSMALTDYLTGCLNRRAFLEQLNGEVKRCKREKGSVSLILIDIDLFKQVNDNYGHLAGDHILQKFSACLSENCRPYDSIGRYGGEEFIVALPNTDLSLAITIAERLRSGVEALRFPDYPQVYLTSSFGVATLQTEDNDNLDSLILRADNALYEAKAQRNMVCVAK